MTAPRAGLLAAAFSAPRAHAGPGRVVMLIAAREKEGVSSSARLAAEEADSPVLLIDLDIKRDGQARHYQSRLGPPRDARVNGLSFYRIKDMGGALLPARAVSRRAVEGMQLDVTAFDGAGLPPQARVQIGADAGYWNALRGAGETALVDAPALARTPLGLRLAPLMDAVVLVVSGEAGGAPAAIEARTALDRAGANVIGIVFARASAPVRIIDRLTRQAG